MVPRASSVLVIGGGPAGLRAAVVARAAGADVILCDAQRSVGHKFLVAGRGGLNLTHGESVENFPTRYGAEAARWSALLSEFGPADLQAWATELGVETYVGSSGRIFPRGQKAAGLLRAWVARLRAAGVRIQLEARLHSMTPEAGGWRAEFCRPSSPDAAEDSLTKRKGEQASIAGRAVVLAMGGASWPDTGSDGAWPALLARHEIEITPWAPANCGWNVNWPLALLERAEGLPLKNLAVKADAESVSGELLITRYGIEGGAIYRLGPILRAMKEPVITLDLKPQLSADALRERLAQTTHPQAWTKAIKLNPAAMALVELFHGDAPTDPDRFVALVKNFTLPLRGPRPIAEAISSAGGIAWRELDDALMLRKLPGLFAAGEMIDWEAPTGGYLLQGCFTTGTRAGRGAAAFARAGHMSDPP